MAIMAKWGPKSWGISAKKIKTLENLSFSFTQVADNNTSTEEKKTTNERGTELIPVTFTSTLNSNTGIDIRSETISWQKLVTKVNYLFLNGKRLGPRYQLRKVSVSNVILDDFGRMRLATLSFEFKEYDPDTTSVRVSTSALKVKPSTKEKAEKKSDNTQIKKAEKKNISVGSYVKITGNKYATGQSIPEWVKNASHEVSQINEGQNKALLGYPGGICSWVYLSEVTLV